MITQNYLQEVRQTLRLGVPMIMGQLGHMSLHLIDSAMVGRVGVIPLAAIAFGGNVVGIVLIMGFGLVSAVPVLVARACGARDYDQCARVLKHGIAVAFVYSVGTAALIHWQVGLLEYFGQPPEVVAHAHAYVAFLAWSVVPTLIFQSFRGFCEAKNRPWMPLFILGLGFLLNVFLNWLFIFGTLGFPAMGAAGAGLATLLARVFMMVGMYLLVRYSSGFDVDRSIWNFFTCTVVLFRRFLKLGIPTAFQILFEAGMFSVAAIFMGWIGAGSLAAHQIAINLASMTFMVPLGMSFAVAIRIGQAAGREDAVAVRRIGFSTFASTVVLMGCCAVVFFLTRWHLPWFFLDRCVAETLETVRLAACFLMVAALFQVFDGLQVVSMGALRGCADVRIPTGLAFIGYWGIGIPMGHFLAFGAEVQSPLFSVLALWIPHIVPPGRSMGGLGIWLGLLIGLVSASVALSTRFHLLTRSTATK